MKKFNEKNVGTFLYLITKYGYPPKTETIINQLKEYSELGYQSIELEGIRETHLLEMYNKKEEIKETADQLNLKIPVFCIVLPGLSSANPSETEKNLSLFEKGCEIASFLGSTEVLDNSPLPPWKFPEGIPVTRHYDEDVLSKAKLPSDLNWNTYEENLVSVFQEVCDIAKNYNLNYHVHPCYGAMINSADSFLLFAGKVKRDNLKFNLDTANQFFLKENLYLALIRLKDHIEYIHISDNRGNKIEHLEKGRGNINWEMFLEGLDQIRYKGMMGIDVGGAESKIDDLNLAYLNTSRWLDQNWFNH